MVDPITEKTRPAPPRRRPRPQRPQRRAPLRLERVEGLDGLRVAGALAVVVYHTMGSVLGANPGAGVIMPPAAFTFFIISGFVIYRPFALGHLNRQRMPDVRRYFTSRCLRVLPLWWIAVTVYLVINGTSALETPLDWIATYSLLQFVIPDVRFAVIGPAWALSVEWIFYLTAPLLAFVLRGVNKRLLPRTDPYAVQITVLLALLSVTAVVAPIRPFIAIISGMLLAVVSVRQTMTGETPSWLHLLRSPSFALLTTVVAWFILVDYPYKDGLSVQWVEQDPLVVVIWIAVALAWFGPVAFGDGTGIITKRLGAPILVRLSLLTFGLYLWHDLILQEVLERLGKDVHLGAALYLTLLGAIVISTFTFVTIERPLMLIRARIQGRQVSLPSDPVGVNALGGGRPAAVATDAQVEHERLTHLPEEQVPDRASSQGRGWLTPIDGLRAVAAIGIVTFHVTAEAGVSVGWSGVVAAIVIPVFATFFVITGFVLYRPWAMAQARISLGDGVAPTTAPDGGIGTFYLRRALRIYPLYWIVQGTEMALNGTGDLRGVTDWFQIITLFPLPDFGVIINTGLGVVVWTLVVDLAFYAVLPLYARAVTAAVRRGTSFTAAQAIPLGLGFGACAYLGSTDVRILAVVACIIVGMGIAAIDAWQRTLRRWVPGVRTVARNPVVIFPVIAIAWAAGAMAAEDDAADLLFQTNLGIHFWAMVAVSSILFLPAVFGSAKGWYRQFLSSRPFRVLGPLTFGIYLWHYPVIRQVDQRFDPALLGLWLAAIVGAGLLAAVTYRLVEAPIGRLRHRSLGATSTSAPTVVRDRSHA